jgi:hypothetical protein
MAHAQKPDFIFRRNGRVHLNRRGRQFSRLLAAEVCASAVVMLDTPCSEVVRRVLATHSIRQFPLHFPSRASPCAVRFQLDSTTACQVVSEARKKYLYPYSSCVLEGGGWSSPRSGRRTPGKEPRRHYAEGWLSLGAVLDGSEKSAPPTGAQTL